MLRITRQTLALVAAALLTGALSGCGRGDADAVQVVTLGTPDAPFAGGVHLSPPAQLVRSATFEGLLGLDRDGRVVPAIADRWIVTDDGTSYIFRMRDGDWPDGSAITGESAGAALRQALQALDGTSLGRDLAGIDEVRAMAGRVVEIRLSRPVPDLLQLLAQPELGLPHRGRGSGPMALQRSGNVAMLTPIPPEKRGLPAIDGWDTRFRAVHLRAMTGEAAVDAFAAGHADVVLGGSFVDLPRTNRNALGKSSARLDPVSGLFGLAVVRSEGLLATPSGREAVAMAIDRDALAASLATTGWAPTTRIVAPGAEDDPGIVGERWSDIAVEGRQIQASRRVVAWVAGSHRPAVVRVALPDGPGADILYDRLNADLAQIGVGVARVAMNAPADLQLVDTVARYPRAAWFLDQLSCSTLHPICNPAADQLAAQAAAATGTQAGNLYAEAENALTASNVYIPLGPPIRWSLVSGEMPGFAPNHWGIHPLMALAAQH